MIAKNKTYVIFLATLAENKKLMASALKNNTKKSMLIRKILREAKVM